LRLRQRWNLDIDLKGTLTELKQEEKQRHNPNPSGRAGKPIILPPTTFEDAVKKMLNTPAPKEDKPKKTTKKRAK